MTKNNDLKRLIRERQTKTGESYTAARRHLLSPPPAAVPTASPTPARLRNPLIETGEDEAQTLLEHALAIEPRLTHFGIGLFDERRRRQAGAQLDDEFTKQRAQLATRLDEIAASADWIKRQRPIASFNRSHNSYGYKHRVERWFRERGEPTYVSNGSFIAAALGLGYEGKLEHPSSPNVCFRFSERTVQLLAQPLPNKNWPK